MAAVSLKMIEPHDDECARAHWVESSDYHDGMQSGTYFIDTYPAASYQKHPFKSIVAHLFTLDEADLPQLLIEIEGRQGPFDTIEQTKAQLEMIARPALGDVHFTN